VKLRKETKGDWHPDWLDMTCNIRHSVIYEVEQVLLMQGRINLLKDIMWSTRGEQT
jgi:hypothetical protein